MSGRHDWYQSETNIVVTVLLKNASEKNVQVNIQSERLEVKANGYELNLELFKPIDESCSSYKVFSTKIEIKLMKIIGERWDTLERKVDKIVDVEPLRTQKKNWDSFTKDFEQKEEEEAQGDEALRRLFQKIYRTADPEVRKAMNKSYSESGGTVLSTNWSEVGQDKVDVKPPDGTEFKKWD